MQLVPERFVHPALRVLRERFPRSGFPPGELATVERIHAEAEIVRIEALRLRVRAAGVESSARLSTGEARHPITPAEAAELRQMSRELSAHALSLFEDAGHAADGNVVASARPPFESMHDWLSRLDLRDRTVDEFDRNLVIWMSLFVTLADHDDCTVDRQSG